MEIQHPLRNFLHKHHLEAVRLPNKTEYWQLSSIQIADLKDVMDKQFTRTAHPAFPREVHIWEKGPVLYEGLFGPGILFQSLEEAGSFLPKIRSHGFSEGEWFEFFALDGEDVKQIFADLDYLMMSRPSTVDAQPVLALEEPYGYLIEGPNLWFPTEEYLRRYDEFIEELMRML